MFDETTAGLFFAAEGAQARAEAVRDSLGSGTLTATVSNGATTHLAGTFAGPMVAGENGSLSIDSALSGAVLVAGTPDAGSWMCRISNAGGRYVEGSFGPGGRFTWSRATMEVGQVARLNISVGGAPDPDPEPDPLAFSGVPSPIQIEQGGTYSLAQHVIGGTPPYSGYAVDSGSLPSGVSINASTGVLTATEGASVGESDDIVFGVDDSEAEDPEPEPGDLPAFGITSAAGGSDLPFAFGHVFAQGDVPTGLSVVSTDATAMQCDIRTTWGDGSACMAVLSGFATCTADVEKSLQLAADTAPGGSNVTLSDLQSLIVDGHNTVALSGIGTVDLHDLVSETSIGYGDAGLVRSFLGPVMSEFHFYSPVGSDAHLGVWFYCRLWSDDSIEIEVYVENGYLLVASPGAKAYTAVVTINNTERYDSGTDLDHRNHTRWGRAFWFGTDPEIKPSHDASYLRASMMVPNYKTGPNESVFSGLSTSLTPFAQGDWPSTMGSAGSNGALLEHFDALYCQTGDPRAFESVIANAYGAGRYGIYYRDEDTMRPALLSDHATLVISGSNLGISDTGASSTSSYTPDNTGTAPPNFAKSHQRTFGYLAYLLTGRWGFMEQVQFQATINALCATDTTRGGASGIIRGDVGSHQTRGMAWAQAAFARALAVTPATDTALRADYKAIVSANIGYYDTNFTDQNNLGLVREYANYEAGNGVLAIAPWQSSFVTQAFCFVEDIAAHLLDSGDVTKLAALTTWLCKLPVGILGGQSTSEYCYRLASNYTIQVADGEMPSNEANWNSALYETWGVVHEETHGSPNTSCAAGDTLLGSSGGAPSLMNGSDRYCYWAILHPGIAFAVDRGITGADAAYARMTGASNYAASTAAFADIPNFAIVPRS